MSRRRKGRRQGILTSRTMRRELSVEQDGGDGREGRAGGGARGDCERGWWLYDGAQGRWWWPMSRRSKGRRQEILTSRRMRRELLVEEDSNDGKEGRGAGGGAGGDGTGERGWWLYSGGRSLVLSWRQHNWEGTEVAGGAVGAGRGSSGGRWLLRSGKGVEEEEMGSNGEKRTSGGGEGRGGAQRSYRRRERRGRCGREEKPVGGGERTSKSYTEDGQLQHMRAKGSRTDNSMPTSLITITSNAIHSGVNGAVNSAILRLALSAASLLPASKYNSRDGSNNCGVGRSLVGAFGSRWWQRQCRLTAATLVMTLFRFAMSVEIRKSIVGEWRWHEQHWWCRWTH